MHTGVLYAGLYLHIGIDVSNKPKNIHIIKILVVYDFNQGERTLFMKLT